jgi:steroid 5-alpha reductase family enzyme
MIAEIFLPAAIAVLILMLGVWVLSLLLKNASIVDIVWGLGFVLIAWVSNVASDGSSAVGLAVALMVSIWGVRLAGYLWWRNHGKGEDFRYVAMRKHYGHRFPWISLITVFGLQGALMLVVALPVQLAQQSDDSSLNALSIVGVLVWIVGVLFESVGDVQLARFKARPENVGKVMDQGLWRFTRHPNYFGDACAWWGIAIVALQSNLGWLGLAGALVMNFLLVRVSGVPMLEKTMHQRRPDYVAYQNRTSGFIPRKPKSN